MTRLGILFCLLSLSALSKMSANAVMENNLPMECASLMQGPASEEEGERLYAKAFVLSFDQKMPLARIYSRCASLIINGTENWPHEASSTVH